MTPHWVTHFLASLSAGCTVVEAARAAGISSTTAYALRKADADFAEAWRLALEDSVDELESVARSRAVHGWQEPVVYQGQMTPVWERDAEGRIVEEKIGEENYKDPISGDFKRRDVMAPRQARNPDGSLKWLTVTKHDNGLLQFLLKGRRKDVFGTDRTEITGRDGAPLQVDDVARRARIAAIVAAAQERAKLA